MGNHITTVVEVDFEYVPVEPKELSGMINKSRKKSHFDFFHMKLSFCHYLSLHRLEPRLPILIRSLHQTACCRRRHLLSGTKPTRQFLSSFFSCVQTSSRSSSVDAYPIPDLIGFARDLDGEFVRPNPYRVVELNVNIMLLSQLTIFSSCGSNTILSDDEPENIVDKHPLNRFRRRRDEYDDDPAAEEFMGGLALKKRRRELADSCRICLEDIEYNGDDHNCAAAGMAALPCGHVYHQNCIVYWLRNSHLCPLCRYPMPAAAALSWP